MTDYLADTGIFMIGLACASASWMYIFVTLKRMEDSKHHRKVNNCYSLVPAAIQRANEVHPNCTVELLAMYALDSLSLMITGFHMLEEAEKIFIKAEIKRQVREFLTKGKA